MGGLRGDDLGLGYLGPEGPGPVAGRLHAEQVALGAAGRDRADGVLSVEQAGRHLDHVLLDWAVLGKIEG